jgi:hypothetical protein
MLKPEEKRCYICGSNKHMANECDRPKKEDPPSKGTSKDGKSGKGKPKGKDGKGKPLIKQVRETPEANGTEKELRRNDSDQTEPENEPQKILSDLEQKVIKALRERREKLASQSNPEDLDTLVEALAKLRTKIKAFKIKDDDEDGERYGLLDSGPTHCVREVQEKEEYHTLIPIDVQVAFSSEVKTKLFMTKFGTIVGPKGTDTIISMSDLTKAGWNVLWADGKVEISKGRIKLPVQIKGNTPVLPIKLCLELIEKIEKSRMMKKEEQDLQIQDVWPQLKHALSWMMMNLIE